MLFNGGNPPWFSGVTLFNISKFDSAWCNCDWSGNCDWYENCWTSPVIGIFGCCIIGWMFGGYCCCIRDGLYVLYSIGDGVRPGDTWCLEKNA